MPWEVELEYPDIVETSRIARTKWITNPETKHYVYSAINGVNPNQRTRKRKADDEGNPPFEITAFIADFDIALDDAEIEVGLKRADIHPQYLEKTLSGNLRAVWLLPKPIRTPSYKICVQMLEMLAEKFKIEELWGGLDLKATTNPTRRWTNSGNWCPMGSDMVDEETLDKWVVGQLSKVDWKDKSLGKAFPMDKVAEELRERYPDFSQWPGDFVDNSQGPTFWVEGSKSPKSAIAHPTGIYTFSGHAGKSFYSWHDLLGKDFVEESESGAIAGAVRDIFHDGRTYWRRASTGDKVWKTANADDVRRALRIYGLSAQKDDEGPSMVDKALEFIQKHQHIDGVAPFIYTSKSIVEYDRSRYLNVYRSEPIRPVPGAAEKKDFPFLWNFLGGVFSSAEELTYFLYWLRHAYTGLHEEKPTRGQILIIVGPANIGKTFLGRYVVGRMFGGFADASRHITGGSQFNEDLFDRPLWCIDDTYMSTDSKTHRRTSEYLKSLAANHEFRVEGKFKKAVTVTWHGRVIMTMNSDALSIQALPNMDISIEEKLLVLRTVEEPNKKFLQTDGKLRLLDQELPHFCRFLLNMKEAPKSMRDERFGVAAYTNESIKGIANQASRFSMFEDIMRVWKDAYFEGKKEECFIGNIYSFYRSLHDLVFLGDKEFSVSYVRTAANWMESQGRFHRVQNDQGEWLWKICKD